MNNFQIRAFVQQLITEAKDAKKAKKEEPKKAAKKDTKKAEPKKEKAEKSNNLVGMKKALAETKDKAAKIDALIADWEQVKSAANSISYSGTDIEIGADEREKIIADCDKEIEKLKKEKASLEEEMTSLKENTASEINKIKEMMGLAAPKKKGAKKMMDEKKEEEVEEARFPKGTDIGKKGPGFKKVAKAAAKEYGSKEAGQKVAGAILKKVIKKGE